MLNAESCSNLKILFLFVKNMNNNLVVGKEQLYGYIVKNATKNKRKTNEMERDDFLIYGVAGIVWIIIIWIILKYFKII